MRAPRVPQRLRRSHADAAAPAPITDPETLRAELARERELEQARRDDALARVQAAAAHRRAAADVAEQERQAELDRAERADNAAAEAALARLGREFGDAGERTRLRSLMARSGEARALRLEQLRALNLRVLVPFLIGFGVWSTTGVQRGAARIMDVTSADAVWWVLWGLEALLIGTVCWIIVVRARLATAGGRLARAAERIAVGALAFSILLNLVAALPQGQPATSEWWTTGGAMFAHALGPVGAAVTAHLIGVIDKSISNANPWRENGVLVPRLATLTREEATAAVADTVVAASPRVEKICGVRGDGILPIRIRTADGERHSITITREPKTATISSLMERMRQATLDRRYGIREDDRPDPTAGPAPVRMAWLPDAGTPAAPLGAGLPSPAQTGPQTGTSAPAGPVRSDQIGPANRAADQSADQSADRPDDRQTGPQTDAGTSVRTDAVPALTGAKDGDDAALRLLDEEFAGLDPADVSIGQVRRALSAGFVRGQRLHEMWVARTRADRSGSDRSALPTDQTDQTGTADRSAVPAQAP